MSTKLLAAFAALISAAAGIWMLTRASPQPPPAEPTPLATATTLATATAQAAATPTLGHRLAGTVVGDVQYAIIEAPDGSNELYHLGETVPGLGALVAIRARSATFSGRNGEYEMKLIAAPTNTPSPVLPVEDDAGDDRDDRTNRDRDDAYYGEDEGYDERRYDERDEDAYFDDRR